MIDNSEQLARIGASTDNLIGDVQRLTLAGQQLQTALDQALADQEQAVQDAVNTAIAETRAEYEAAIKPFADRLDALAAQTPEPQPEPEPEPPAA